MNFKVDDWDILLGLHAMVAGSTHIHILAFRRGGVPFSHFTVPGFIVDRRRWPRLLNIERGGLVLVVWLVLGVVGFVLGRSIPL